MPAKVKITSEFPTAKQVALELGIPLRRVIELQRHIDLIAQPKIAATKRLPGVSKAAKKK